jgi:hypothetical protein
VKANRLKPSTAEAYESVFRTHLEPAFGSLRLDAIGDELVLRGRSAADEQGDPDVDGARHAAALRSGRTVSEQTAAIGDLVETTSPGGTKPNEGE